MLVMGWLLLFVITFKSLHCQRVSLIPDGSPSWLTIPIEKGRVLEKQEGCMDLLSS